MLVRERLSQFDNAALYVPVDRYVGILAMLFDIHRNSLLDESVSLGIKAWENI